MAATRQRRLTEKKVFFYRISIDGQVVERNEQLNVHDILSRIKDLPFSEEGRYEADEEDAIVSSFVDGRDHFRFGRIRRSNLPPVANGPKVTQIPIAANAGLFECSHVIYFGNGVLGAEFNNYAPRIASRLGHYLSTKSSLGRRLEIMPIIRGNPIDALNRLQNIRSISIKVATDEARTLERNKGGLLARIAASAAQEGIEILDVTMKTSKGRSGAISDNVLSALRNIVLMPNVRETVEKLSVSGYIAGKTTLDAIDLLADDLVISKQFLRENVRTKTLDSRAAYAKIREAYEEVRNGIQRAQG